MSIFRQHRHAPSSVAGITGVEGEHLNTTAKIETIHAVTSGDEGHVADHELEAAHDAWEMAATEFDFSQILPDFSRAANEDFDALPDEEETETLEPAA